MCGITMQNAKKVKTKTTNKPKIKIEENKKVFKIPQEEDSNEIEIDDLIK